LPRVGGASEVRPQSEPGAGRKPSLRSLSDQELLEGIRRGSEAHFTELYDRYFQRIYNFCYVRLRNHADVEEIVQETFTVVFRSVDSYRGQSSLLSWVYGIAKNTANNHLRRAKAQESRMERAEPDLLQPPSSLANCTPEEQLHLRRYAEAINRHLDSVAEWQAEIFLMRHVENLSIREISDRTERSSDAIRSSLYRVKRILVEAAAEPSAQPAGR
jgi:RNA polymerase sigma-70 factor (ECF subfamily)